MDVTKDRCPVEYHMHVEKVTGQQDNNVMVFSEYKNYDPDQENAIYEYELLERKDIIKSGLCVEHVICSQLNK